MMQEVSSQSVDSDYRRADASADKGASAKLAATKKMTKSEIIEWAAHKKNIDWTFSNQRALVKKYPNKSIAVYNCEVIADADTVGELLQAVDLLSIPRSKTFIKFMDADPAPIIPCTLYESYD